MTTTLRIDDELKRDCEIILEDLGLSMSGAISIFLRQIVKQRAIPFVISCDRVAPLQSSFQTSPDGFAERGRLARRAARELRESCDREWTPDEIDAEIAAARAERCLPTRCPA